MRPWWIVSLLVMAAIAGCISLGAWGYYFFLASSMGWEVPMTTTIMALIQVGIAFFAAITFTKGTKP